MTSTIDETQTKFSIYFTSLSEYIKNSVVEIQRALEQKNQAIVQLLQENPSLINKALQQKILETATMQKRADIFHTTLNFVEFIQASTDSPQILIQRAPNVFESILWLLRSFTKTKYLAQVQEMIEEISGKSTLENLEQFSNINPEAMKKEFLLKFTHIFIKEYVCRLKSLYRFQTNNEVEQLSQDSDNENDESQIPNSPKFNVPCLQGTINQKPETPNFGITSTLTEPLVSENSVTMKNDEPDIAYSKSSKIKFPKKVSPKQSKEGDVEENRDNVKFSAIKGVRTENLKLYKKIKTMLETSKTSFTDSSFTPDLSCITSQTDQLVGLRNIIWKRIPDVYKNKELTLCSSHISSDDVLQGKLKNCYFLSALCVLAEKQHFIQRLFESKEFTNTGCYSIWLCDSGEWKNVIIDDYIPCIISKKNQLIPYFSKIRGNDIWVSLLEKAYAKLYGSYFCLQGGYQAEAYYALTGAPVKSFHQKTNKVDSMEKLWAFIANSLNKGFVITASCDEDPALDTKAMGLLVYHSYALLDVKEIQLKDGKQERLIKLKNPWGWHEWKGKWGDSSPCWTPQLIKEIDYIPKKKDGIFWMSLEDVNKYFHHINACQLHNDYGYSFLKLGERKKENIFLVKMVLSSPGHIYLSVQQKNKKHFKNNNDYKYSYVRLVLAKIKDGKISSIIQANYDCTQMVFIEANLTKGKYFVLTEIEWAQNLYHQLNLTAYSNVDVKFKEHSLENYHIPSIYQDLYTQYVLGKKCKKAQVHQYELEGKQLQVWRHEVKKFGLRILLYQNKELDEFDVTLSLNDMKNMDIIVPEGREMLLNVCVRSGQEQIVILKANPKSMVEKDCCFKYTETFTMRQELKLN